MKKENIIWVLFPVIWVFWFFFMRGHIGYWEETNFFQSDSRYWTEFLFKPGGWSEYAGYFLLQFYRQAWLGALIATLLPLGVFVLTRGIVRKLGLLKYGLIISAVPFVLVCLFMCDQRTFLGDTLKIFFFFLSLWGFLQITKLRLRYVLFSLAYPLIFLLLGGGSALMLYVVLALYELRRANISDCWMVLACWLILASVFPWLWGAQVYVMPAESVYHLPFQPGYLDVMLGGFLILLWGLSRFRYWQKGNIKVYLSFAELLLVIAGWGACMFYAYDKQAENFFRMDQAAERGDWDQVLQMAELSDNLSREQLYLTGLALAGRGELGNRLFEFPVNGLGCLYLPRESDYKTSVLGGEFYYRMKIPNEALHWTFQASVSSSQGMDFRTLRRLAELNVMKRDTLLADKYLTILENAVGHGNWCREKRREMQDPLTAFVLPDTTQDFFIGGRPFLSDMARVLDAGRSQDMTLDYVLCGLLLNKDLNKFCQLFGMFHSQDGKQIAKAYQEALLVAMTVGNKTIVAKNYGVDPEIMKRFQDYNALYRTCSKNKEQARELMKEFKGTWWYYFHFTDLKPMDEKGHVLNFEFMH